jgi:hypothetical protein
MPNKVRLDRLLLGVVVALTVALAGAGRQSAGLEAAAGVAGLGQDEPEKPKEGKAKQDKAGKGVGAEPAVDPSEVFFSLPTGMRIGAAMQMFATKDPISLAVTRVAPAASSLFPNLGPEWELELTRPLPLTKKYLRLLQDGSTLPTLPKEKPLFKFTPEEWAYPAVLAEALLNSSFVDARNPDLFAEAAKENSYVTFDHLFKEPNQYRGEVVPVIGRMLRLRQWKADDRMREFGVPFVYEAWIAGPTRERPPYWIVFTRLPEGLEPQETMSRPVRFYGYFLKLVRNKGEKLERLSPLVVGPTVYLEGPAPVVQPSMFSRDVLFAVLAGLLAIGVVLVALGLFFRRSDKAVHRKLADLRDKRTMNFEPEAEEAPPAQAGSVLEDEKNLHPGGQDRVE